MNSFGKSLHTDGESQATGVAVSTAFEVTPETSYAIQYNNFLLSFYRNFTAVVGGSLAGVLGLKGFSGLLTYLILNICLLFAVYVKAYRKFSLYFRESFVELLFENFLDKNAFLSYILFWILFFSITYLF